MLCSRSIGNEDLSAWAKAGHRAARCVLRTITRRACAPRWPIRLRQDHAAQPHCRTGPPRLRRDYCRRIGCHWHIALRGASYRNERVGFIFQSYNLLPQLTALDNILVPMLPKRQADPRRAQELLDAVGLSDRARHRPSELSGGEQQRVAIARALVNDPTLILADEPVGNLDDENAGKIAKLLASACRERGKTLILVTHDRNLIQPVDHVFDMRSGSLTSIESVFAS